MIIIIEKLTKNILFLSFCNEDPWGSRNQRGRKRAGESVWAEGDDGLLVGWFSVCCVFGEQRYGDMKGWLVALNDFIYFIYCFCFQCYGITGLIFFVFLCCDLLCCCFTFEDFSYIREIVLNIECCTHLKLKKIWVI